MSLLSQEKCCLSDSKAERGKMLEEEKFFGTRKTRIPSSTAELNIHTHRLAL